MQVSPKADIAVIGLAVMGQNLILNMNDHGFTVVAFNRTLSKVDDFLAKEAKDTKVIGAHSIEEVVSLLKRPRRVMLMVKAGAPVDEFIDKLLPHLEPGDIIIDGGNSFFKDTIRRTKYVESKGLLYIGTGVSGGEEGARHGPSIMPGGSVKAWAHIKDIFQKIAAKAEDGSPCCEWMGENGAGHYVKMVHNGIEYGDMQLIAEAYQLMKVGLNMSAAQMSKIFAEWDNAELDSYLIEITAMILAYTDTDGSPLIDKILDTAGQKGTGKWTVIESAELGQPVTIIAEAMFGRSLSALKDERVNASKKLSGPNSKINRDKKEFIEDIRHALYVSKITSYAQGFMLMRAAMEEYSWKLDFGKIASIWRAGCVIRSVFLGKIKAAYDTNPNLQNLLLDDFFKDAINENQESWRKVVAAAALSGVPTPCMAAALAFYDGYRSGDSPANLLQAQRDVFGAHTYERLDKPRGEFFHTNWTGHGGDTSSTTYNA